MLLCKAVAYGFLLCEVTFTMTKSISWNGLFHFTSSTSKLVSGSCVVSFRKHGTLIGWLIYPIWRSTKAYIKIVSKILVGGQLPGLPVPGCGPDKTNILRKTSKILHTLLSKNYAAKCFLLCWRPNRMNYVVRMLAMTDCGCSPVHGFTVVVALQYWSKNKTQELFAVGL